jgi:UDP-GlcNAc:undecaprenyl-phosphate GlcNAc-1-phosphate transferase
MDTKLAAGVGFAVGGAAALASTPAAIRLAVSLDFYDRPREYRQHGAATPFLGGAGVVVAFLIAAVAVGAINRSWVLLVCAVAMLVIGTIDDTVTVAPRWRLISEVAVACALVVAGLGWSLPEGGALNAVLTIVWVVGIVNAFNLMDNLDGACATVAGVSALGIGTLAIIGGEPALAGMAFALAAASAAFLRWNLAGPARVFLGDGGSMPVGFLVAALAMAVSRGLRLGDAALPALGLTAGVAILDTTLVSVSRIRRGVPLWTGGRDHLTHRLLSRCRSPRSVAARLALVQLALCGLAVAGDRLGSLTVVLFAVAAVLLGVGTIAVLDGPRWRPSAIAPGTSAGASVDAAQGRATSDDRPSLRPRGHADVGTR